MAESRQENLDEDIQELFRLAAELGVSETDDFFANDENVYQEPASSSISTVSGPVPVPDLQPVPVPSLQPVAFSTRYVEFSETDKQELTTEQQKKNTVRSTS